MPTSRVGGWRRVGVGAVDWGRAILERGRGLIDKTTPASLLTVPSDAPAECAALPVVVLPGVLEQWHFLAALQRSLNRAGHPVVVVPQLGWNLLPLAESVTLVAAALGRLEQPTVVVGHSKGGLIGRALLADPRTADRVAGLVATCTPWQGSSLVPAWTAGTPLGMFRSGAVAVGGESRIVSLAPGFDQVIPEGSRLDGATNIELPCAGHFAPTRDPQTHTLIHRFVHELAGRR